MSGNLTVKSFSAFQVNEALVAKVVEALKTGEADARRYGQVKSFEIYYEGFRERLVFGRIMVVPAKAADSVEDFPAALLYGAMVREISPESQADMYSHKLGESEFDEYTSKADLAEIKKNLFTDSEGTLRSIVIFIPTWANVRDYVIFKFTRDWGVLAELVRHQIYGCYYDPRLSTAFDALKSDTERLDISDITPKVDFPGFSAGEKSFPNLEPGDKNGKTAATQRPRVLLAADNAASITEEFLEPGEKAVITELTEEFAAHVSGEIETPQEAAKTAAPRPEDYETKHYRENSHGETVAGYQCSACKAQFNTTAQLQNHAEVCPESAEPMPKGVTNGLRRQPDYGESDAHTTVANGLAAKDAASSLAKSAAYAPDLTADVYIEWGGMYDHRLLELDSFEGKFEWTDNDTNEALDLGKRIGVCTSLDQAVRELKDEVFGIGEPSSYIMFHHADGNDEKATKADHVKPHDRKLLGEMGIAPELSATLPVQNTRADDKKFLNSVGIQAKKKASSTQVLKIEGARLVRTASGLEAHSPNGHKETLRINGNKIKWQRSQQFTAAFRAAAETYIRNPKNEVTKQADVPLTFDAIWNDITENLGPAPQVQVKTPESGSSAPSGSEPKNPSSPAPAAPAVGSGKSEEKKEEKAEEAAPEKKPWEKEPTGTSTPNSEKKEASPRGNMADINEQIKALEVMLQRAEANEQFAQVKILQRSIEKLKAKRDSTSTPNSENKSASPRGNMADINEQIKALEVMLQRAQANEQVSQVQVLQRSIEKLKAKRDSDNAPSADASNRLAAKIAAMLTEEDMRELGKRTLAEAKGKCTYCGCPMEHAAGMCKSCGSAHKCGVCGREIGVGHSDWNETEPEKFIHISCKEKAKQAAFDMFIPGQVLKEFYPEIQGETVEAPNENWTGPTTSPAGLPEAGTPYVSTDPTAAMGLGRDGKSQVLEGAPLRQENDIRGYQFDQEYYAQHEGIDPKAFVAVLAFQKEASASEEIKAQFADFLKKAMGEIAASFIAAFKCTNRPLLTKVPGNGEIKLDEVERNMTLPTTATFQVASRVRDMLQKINDSDLQQALNDAYCQAAVWNEDSNGGFTYEVFVRPESIDKQTAALRYSFVMGTKGL